MKSIFRIKNVVHFVFKVLQVACIFLKAVYDEHFMISLDTFDGHVQNCFTRSSSVLVSQMLSFIINRKL